MNHENKISTTKNFLLVLASQADFSKELIHLTQNFCGTVIHQPTDLPASLENKKVYVCGDLSQISSYDLPLYIIEELSTNYGSLNVSHFKSVCLGQVPIIIHHAGVYFRDFFGEHNYFNRIASEHIFQRLTESNKQGKALRKGIYLTDIHRTETVINDEELHYRLLRCSSNLTGPTDNFRITDREIIAAVNDAAESVFTKPAALNHVLAQIYTNEKETGERTRERKAKISAHSDKTKDMLPNGLIAFCTFYDQDGFSQLQPAKTDRYDWCYKKTSGLTRLHFKLKKTVEDATLTKEFSVTLYPNSVFMIPLSTNRLYTHAIKPSLLNIDRIPTRMGYVVRSSKAEAVFIDGKTYLKEAGELVKLELMTEEMMHELRSSYYQENKTEDQINYGKVHFSMNAGDYQKPIY